MKAFALEEIQSIFHRQIKDNAIDVFLANFKESSKRIDFGQIKEDQNFRLYTPSRSLYSERSYLGSSLSYSVADVFNKQYGILAVCAELINKAQRTVAREVVRGLIKNSIAVTAAYFDQNITEDSISKDTALFPHKDAFYARAFNPIQIRFHMRRSALRRLDTLYVRRKQPRRIQLEQDGEQVNSFVNLCNTFGLHEISELIAHLADIEQSAHARDSMKGIVSFFQMWLRTNNKAFYKELNKLFI